MPGVVSRQEIVDRLTRALRSQPAVRAAWLGGSDASGRTDQWSDIDIQMVAEDDAVEAAFSTVHEALEALSPILHRYRFPTPTWHGHEQELLSLRDAEPFHFVDLVIMRRTSKDWLLEPERHGNAVILFDEEGLLAPAPFDRDAHQEKMRVRLAVLRQMFPLLQNIVTKAALREAGPDAMASYMAHSVRPLVELLRMRYCPDRFDYGLRYLDRDLPPELRAEIDSLVFPGSVGEVEANRKRVQALFEDTLHDLDAGEWSLSSSQP